MPDQKTKPGRRYWLIMARGILRFVAILAAMFFLAGRLSYWQAWGYGGMGLLLGLTVAVLFVRKPDVIKERVRPGSGMKWWDKVFFALYIPSFLAVLAVASLDAGRYHWTAAMPVAAPLGAVVPEMPCGLAYCLLPGRGLSMASSSLTMDRAVFSTARRVVAASSALLRRSPTGLEVLSAASTSSHLRTQS